MRVKIINQRPGVWYHNKAGDIITVSIYEKNPSFYFFCTLSKNDLVITTSDCEILPEENPQPEPFDLERALKGEKVVMRDGTEIQEVVAFKTAERLMPVMAAYKDGINMYTADGKYHNGGDMIADLFMAPKEPQVVTRWVNVFNQSGDIVTSGTYKSEMIAIEYGKHATGYLKTIPVTFTI